MRIEDPIRTVPTLGPRYAKKCQQLGITTIRDLLLYAPRKYDDLSRIVSIADVEPNVRVTICAEVLAIQNRRAHRKRMMITEALLRDASGEAKAIWFHQPFLTNVLTVGKKAWFSGEMKESRYGLNFSNPVYEIEQDETMHTGRIVPVYSTREKITQKQLRALIHAALPAAASAEDILPDNVRTAHALLTFSDALQSLHFPKDAAELERAVRYFAFHELFLHHLRALADRHVRNQEPALSVVFDEASTRQFVSTLPFQPTDDQRRAAWEIILDLENSAHPMERLLQGDVGSGKTLVAAIALLNVARAGARGVLMAPTALLAEQHFATLASLYRDAGIDVALLTRERRAWNVGGITQDGTKTQFKKACAENKIPIIVGTHALLFDKTIEHDDVRLVIVDEQHRFGVRQRNAVKELRVDKVTPHFLSMTATPIPRTLALTLFADLSVSSLRTMPKERKPVRTRIVLPEKRNDAYAFIKKELDKKRQIFVICPLIDPSDTLGVRSVTVEFERLKRDVFQKYRVALLHGRLAQKKRDAVMRAFAEGTVDVLVATSVVEVGIDIPNATIMMIEGAERFGLAQLHQFRGRVGRGAHQSYCLLFPDGGETVPERLSVMEQTTDGFRIAEHDLKLRGPGAFLGTEQHGFLDFQFATLGDVELIRETRRAAEALFANDPSFTTCPALHEQIQARRELS